MYISRYGVLERVLKNLALLGWNKVGKDLQPTIACRKNKGWKYSSHQLFLDDEGAVEFSLSLAWAILNWGEFGDSFLWTQGTFIEFHQDMNVCTLYAFCIFLELWVKKIFDGFANCRRWYCALLNLERRGQKIALFRWAPAAIILIRTLKVICAFWMKFCLL